MTPGFVVMLFKHWPTTGSRSQSAVGSTRTWWGNTTRYIKKRKGSNGMWWGRGDTSQLDEKVRATLDHLRRLDETGHLTVLDARRAEIAVRAVHFYDQWESALKLASSIKNVALLVGALLAIYWATEGWIVHRIIDIVGGAQ